MAGLILTSLMVAAAGGLFALATPKEYVSSASVLVGPVTSDVDTLRAAESLTSTYSQLYVRPKALQTVADQVGLTSEEVDDASDVTFNTETRIVTLTVTTSSASVTQRIASGLTAQLTNFVGTVDPTAPGALRVISVQPQTTEEVSRSVVRYAALAGVGWLLLAVGVLAAFSSRPADPARANGGAYPDTGGGSNGYYEGTHAWGHEEQYDGLRADEYGSRRG